ncbi:hypothetical protein PG993_012570 [Apiospora rasikravindrae]|uniref:MYND-type zinc finger protein samB n=1 Tax=Apiospora rasikravindrae TaxID=990691 RepID=A0ABR1S2T4_9PEZI
MENTNKTTKMPEANNEAKDSGPCIVCGKQTPRLCLICGEDFICSELCNEPDLLPAAHMPACKEDESTTGYDLKTCLAMDRLPSKPQTMQDFGFDRCDARSDKQNLWGVYHTLVVSYGISAPQLNRWSAARELRKHIAELFDDRGRAEEFYGINENYVDWFKTHAHVFDGGIHGSGGGTQAEETGDFWPNLRGRLNQAFF